MLRSHTYSHVAESINCCNWVLLSESSAEVKCIYVFDYVFSN